MKKFLKLWLLLLGALLSFYSCKKDEPITFSNSALESPNWNIMENRQRFGKSLSIAISKPKVLNFIKERALAKENGDQVFLYALAKDETVLGKNQSLATILNESDFSSSNLEKNASGSEEFYNHELVANDPKLSMYLFVPDDHQGTVDQERISRVYIDLPHDNFTERDELVFFEDGIERRQKATEIPTEPVFVIKENERILPYDPQTQTILPYNKPLAFLGDIRKARFLSTEGLVGILNGIEYRAPNNKSGTVVNASPTAVPATPPPLPPPCDRDHRYGKDEVTILKYKHDYESWTKGKPEFQLDAVFASASGAGNVQASLSSSDVWDIPSHWDEDEWGVIGHGIINWRPEESNHSLNMLYNLVEVDNGPTINIGVAFQARWRFFNANVNLNIQFQDGDDQIGQEIVEYCDNWTDPDIPLIDPEIGFPLDVIYNGQQWWNIFGYRYKIGDVFFHIKERNF